MGNEIVTGMTIKLNAVFGEEYDIFTEPVEQGLGDRCFFITSLKPQQTPMIGRRKFRVYPFDIAYLSDFGEEDRLAVLDKLMDEMEFITLADGTVMHGTGMNAEMEDGILHFCVSYNTFVYVPDRDDSEPMENLHIEMKG